jgi:elongator complex protein 3
MRIMREIPPVYLTAGTIRIDLRKDVEAYMKNKKIKLKEIRFREIGFAIRDKAKKELINKDLKLKIIKYKASEGEEFFLQIVNKDNILFALSRLRISGSKALIRELHVYGKTLPLGKKSKESFQHKGLGKLLMKHAEEIVKKSGIRKLAVISGVGVREYYRKLGYRLEKEYMTKTI